MRGACLWAALLAVLAGCAGTATLRPDFPEVAAPEWRAGDWFAYGWLDRPGEAWNHTVASASFAPGGTPSYLLHVTPGGGRSAFFVKGVQDEVLAVRRSDLVGGGILRVQGEIWCTSVETMQRMEADCGTLTAPSYGGPGLFPLRPGVLATGSYHDDGWLIFRGCGQVSVTTAAVGMERVELSRLGAVDAVRVEVAFERERCGDRTWVLHYAPTPGAWVRLDFGGKAPSLCHPSPWEACGAGVMELVGHGRRPMPDMSEAEVAGLLLPYPLGTAAVPATTWHPAPGPARLAIVGEDPCCSGPADLEWRLQGSPGLPSWTLRGPEGEQAGAGNVVSAEGLAAGQYRLEARLHHPNGTLAAAANRSFALDLRAEGAIACTAAACPSASIQVPAGARALAASLQPSGPLRLGTLRLLDPSGEVAAEATRGAGEGEGPLRVAAAAVAGAWTLEWEPLATAAAGGSFVAEAEVERPSG